MNPSRYELYLDYSGSSSKCGVGYEFVTVAGISLLPDITESLRRKVAGLPKWKDTNRINAEKVALLIKGEAVVALTLRVYKDPGAWRRFWNEANEHYSRRAQAEKAIQVRYLKPESAVQRELYGECSARLVGETVKRVGHPTVRDSHGLGVLRCKVVVDSDIQGRANQAAFFLGWVMVEHDHPLMRRHGLTVSFSDVAIATEQNEPLLLLADHLAGAIQCIRGDGSVRRPKSLSESDLTAVRAIYETLPNYTGMEKVLDRQYRDHLGEADLGGDRSSLRM